MINYDVIGGHLSSGIETICEDNTSIFQYQTKRDGVTFNGDISSEQLIGEVLVVYANDKIR